MVPQLFVLPLPWRMVSLFDSNTLASKHIEKVNVIDKMQGRRLDITEGRSHEGQSASDVAWLNPTHVTSNSRFLSLIARSEPMPYQRQTHPRRTNNLRDSHPTPHFPRTIISHLKYLASTRERKRKDALHLPTSHPHPALQLARLVEPTAPAPPHRRHRLLRQDRARLLAHQLRPAVHNRRRPQALHPLMRLETQQRRRERAGHWQL